MRPFAFLAVLIASSVTATAQAAGFRLLDVPADAGGPSIDVAVWSPCSAPPAEVRFRFLTIPAVRDCPIVGDRLPLIVISHGSGGWFGAHHDTAALLADAGFVVAALNHPGDTATDRSRIDSLSTLVDRPVHIHRLLDFMLGAWPEASKLDGQRVGFFGFSRGAYTGLVVAGGQLDIPKIVSLCPEGFINGMCEQISKGELPGRRPAGDRRFKAAVLADIEFGRTFSPEQLQDVKIPIQLWSSSRGGDGVLPVDGATVDDNLPIRPDYRVVPKSAHFAFIAPCSAAMASAVPEICVDEPAFDRVAFHQEFNAAALALFRKELIGR